MILWLVICSSFVWTYSTPKHPRDPIPFPPPSRVEYSLITPNYADDLTLMDNHLFGIWETLSWVDECLSTQSIRLNPSETHLLVANLKPSTNFELTSNPPTMSDTLIRVQGARRAHDFATASL